VNFRTIAKSFQLLVLLPRTAKIILVLGIDFNLAVLSLYFAIALRRGEFEPLVDSLFFLAMLSGFIWITFGWLAGFYRPVFRYPSPSDFSAITRALLSYALVMFPFIFVITVPGAPRTVAVIQPLILFVLTIASRISFGKLGIMWDSNNLHHDPDLDRVVRVKVGSTSDESRRLVQALREHHTVRIVAFFSDDQTLIGRSLNGVKVEPYPGKSGNKVSNECDQVVLSSEDPQLDSLVTLFSAHGMPLNLVRSTGLFSARTGVPQLPVSNLDIEDLLGRHAVSPIPTIMGRSLQGKVVMVTGAGGSIGSELCRQIIGLEPAEMILVDSSELALYRIRNELDAISPDSVCIRPFLADLSYKIECLEIFRETKPQIVFHAAAYKHVELVESNPITGLRNNVLSALYAADCAVLLGTEKFVLVSSDKAVRPTNIMGASKRLAEQIVLSHPRSSACIFCAVRFGNVLGSSGSVVPKFRSQIMKGGPVTVTDKHVTRYFMSIAEAAELLLHAVEFARPNSVFILDMGEPVKIVDLARKMISIEASRYGRNPDSIHIVYTGLKPGEKLHEQLYVSETVSSTDHPKIMRVIESQPDQKTRKRLLNSLDEVLRSRKHEELKILLNREIPDYTSSGIFES